MNAKAPEQKPARERRAVYEYDVRDEVTRAAHKANSAEQSPIPKNTAVRTAPVRSPSRRKRSYAMSERTTQHVAITALRFMIHPTGGAHVHVVCGIEDGRQARDPRRSGDPSVEDGDGGESRAPYQSTFSACMRNGKFGIAR